MGYCESSLCQRCGQVGYLHHPFWTCPHSQEVRSRAADEELRAMAAQSDVADLFLTRASLPRAMLPVIPPPVDTQR
eukprot:8740242-Pyramimonas_sp.AAC.1